MMTSVLGILYFVCCTCCFNFWQPEAIFTFQTVLNISLSKIFFINARFRLFFLLNISLDSICKLC